MAGKRAIGFIIFRRISEEIQYLLLQTSYGIHHWTPPKGHVDPGEDDMTTAYRETQEEAGFLKEHLKVHKDFKVKLNYLVNGKEKTTIYWLAELLNCDTPVILSEEHQKYEWLDLKKACDYVHFEDMQKALYDCQNFIKEYLNN